MRIVSALAAVALTFAPGVASAKTVIVSMKNFANGKPMVFEPALVRADVGDTVLFKAVDKGHDAKSARGMVPTGAAPIAGKMSQDTAVKLTKPGLYGVQCTPHVGMGMVALVAVGPGAPNMADARAAANTLPGLGKRNMNQLLDQIKAK